MHTVIVVALALAVCSHARRMVTNVPMDAKDLAASMGVEKSASLIDTICGQTADWFGDCRGAFNELTNISMAWNEYRSGPGRFEDPEFMFARYPWATFKARCTPWVESTWVTDRDAEFGQRVFNFRQDPRNLPLTVDYTIPRFSCTTTLPTMYPLEIRLDFNAMFNLFSQTQPVLLPAAIRNSWDMRRERSDRIHHSDEYMIPACHSAWLTVASVLRTVRINPVMSIDLYYWSGVPPNAHDGRP
jgi:hypothetical protein